ncbi:unnamed protein product [Symbiodinium pilosum]|uniref:Uncharacterized protein n=1 Tax=Symbiodinium pilosum TaxID=2952 RepID=A0A812RI27_SYMPI|nr:unnamed protein product [Symbiodinium pilosum]
MGKGDGKWGKKGEVPGAHGASGGPGVPSGPGAPGAWKGIAKWGGKGDRSEKGNWISQPEDGPDLKRARLDPMGPSFSLKGREKGKDGPGKGLAPVLSKGMAMQPDKPEFGFGGKGEDPLSGDKGKGGKGASEPKDMFVLAAMVHMELA